MRQSLNLMGGAALSILLACSSVAAQQTPNLLLPTAGQQPVNANDRILQGVDPQAEVPAVQQPRLAAPMPVQPTGGFDTVPPSVGAEDPATRMTLDGAGTYVDNLNEQSNARLGALTGATVSNSTASDLEVMMEIQRSNMLLGLRNEEAELAVSLWGTLYNNEHAQAWREREEAQAAERKKAEESATAARMATLASQSQAPASTVYPVVFEVNNGTAILRMLGGAEVYARAGTVLPNGMTVVSVGQGVVVDNAGSRVNLAFGTAVTAPAAPISNMAIQQQ